MFPARVMGFFHHDAFTQVRGHVVDTAGMQLQFGRDLLIGQI